MAFGDLSDTFYAWTEDEDESSVTPCAGCPIELHRDNTTFYMRPATREEIRAAVIRVLDRGLANKFGDYDEYVRPIAATYIPPHEQLFVRLDEHNDPYGWHRLFSRESEIKGEKVFYGYASIKLMLRS